MIGVKILFDVLSLNTQYVVNQSNEIHSIIILHYISLTWYQSAAMADASSGSGFISSPNIASLNNPNFLLVNPANQVNSVKLTDENYLLWNLQVLAGLRGLGLESFISIHPPVPPQVLSVDETSEVVNPAFITWCRQDQLLFSFLLASMSESVQTQMIGCESSAQLWSRVSTIFATRSKARVMHYKLQLQTCCLWPSYF